MAAGSIAVEEQDDVCRVFIMIVCAGVSDSVFHENFINGLMGALAASEVGSNFQQLRRWRPSTGPHARWRPS